MPYEFKEFWNRSAVKSRLASQHLRGAGGGAATTETPAGRPALPAPLKSISDCERVAFRESPARRTRSGHNNVHRVVVVVVVIVDTEWQEGVAAAAKSGGHQTLTQAKKNKDDAEDAHGASGVRR